MPRVDFDFVRARSVEEALEAAGEGARFVAGGTNLVPDVLFGRARPRRVIDISRLPELRYIREADGRLHLGALATVTDLLESPLVRRLAPPLRASAVEFAGPLVRNRATVAGNLVDASPAADLAVPLLAQDGHIHLRGRGGRRRLPLGEFFLAYRRTALAPGEMVTGVDIRPAGGGARTGYHKLQLRRAMAISVVSVTTALWFEGGRCAQAGVALGAVAPVPSRAGEAEDALRGRPLDEASIEAAAEAAARAARPIDDLRASAEYRRRMCRVLVRRLLREALGSPAARERGGGR